MLVGIAGLTEEMCINPRQFVFGKSLKGSPFGGTKRKSKAFCKLFFFCSSLRW